MLEMSSTISSRDETEDELLSHGFKAFLPTADKLEENGDNSKEGVCTYRGTAMCDLFRNRTDIECLKSILVWISDTYLYIHLLTKHMKKL